MARGGTRRRYAGEDYGMGRKGSGVYAGHGYGGTSRTRYRHAYGGSRRRWTPGYSRTGGYYGRYNYAASPGGELKFHDVDLVDAVIAATGTITPSINLIAQGVTESERNGRKCTLKGISWRFRVTLPIQENGTSPNGDDSMRVILFNDKQCNGATAAVLDILETADYKSFRNLANSGRFNIICDKSYSLHYKGMASEGAGLLTQASVINNYSFHSKLNLPLEFNATTGAITEIRSNNLGVLLISDVGIGGFDSKIRLRFTDASAGC